MSDRIGVLFVCLGNICRSPLAEAAFRQTVTEAGMADRFEIDSAGTSGFHAGEAPDERMREVALSRGLRLTGRARQVKAEDFQRFDYIIAMDADNLESLQSLANQSTGEAEIHLLRSFDPESTDELDVPDPYYGGRDGFELVYDLVERACAGLLDHIRGGRGS